MIGKLRRLAFYILILVIVFVFGSVALNFFKFEQDTNIAFVRDDSRPEKIINVVCGVDDPRTRLFVDMAELSSTIYLDQQENQHASFLNEWTRENVIKPELNTSNRFYTVSGLKLEIWLHPATGVRVIVFRGTKSLFSWQSNFHWIFKWFEGAKDQYEQVREFVPQLLDELQKGNSENQLTVYATGHSLGGGLAQHALYADHRISMAFAFNSSPVTGWTDFEEQHLERSVIGNRIYRIHENGEALEFFRLLMKAGYVLNPKPNKDPYFKEYRFNLKGGGLFDQHGITELSINLREIQKKNCPSKTAHTGIILGQPNF